MFKISPLKLSEMMAEVRTTFPQIWERIITPEKTIPSTELMKAMAKLDPDFVDKNYNGVQLMQIIYDKKELYLDLISKPEPKPLEPPDADQCAPTLEAEALERLRMIVDINFKTIRGLVLLESDLALFEIGTDVSAWLEKMKTEWEARLHSEWLDEFMEALQLWILSKT